MCRSLQVKSLFLSVYLVFNCVADFNCVVVLSNLAVDFESGGEIAAYGLDAKIKQSLDDAKSGGKLTLNQVLANLCTVRLHSCIRRTGVA